MRHRLAIMAVLIASFGQAAPSGAQSTQLACRDCPFPMGIRVVDPDAPFPLRSGPEVPFPLHSDPGVPFRLAARFTGATTSLPQIADRTVQVSALRLAMPLSPIFVVAVGQFISGGWSGATLVPAVYIVPPADGIYDFSLAAIPPSGPSTMQLSYLIATTVVQLPADAKGVRVQSATNTVVSTLPSIERALTLQQTLDYQSWIGKRLVRINEDYSGGDPVIRESELPRPYRIFTPESNMGDMMFNPDRINIRLDANGLIVSVTIG